MHFAVPGGAVAATHLRRVIPGGTSNPRDSSAAVRLRSTLKRVDKELSSRNYKAALSLVRQLQGKPEGLSAFGAAKQVPKRFSSLDELKFNEVDSSSLQPLIDSILDSIERSYQFALLDENSFDKPESFASEESNVSFSEKDHQLCSQHEAGHFLVAYLLGILPRRYKIPGVKDIVRDKFAGGSVEFIGFEFLREVAGTKILKEKRRRGESRGNISSTTLNRFSCVILGGLVAEHLAFGYSEGLHCDVEKLAGVLKWLGFSHGEVDTHVKWATLNTTLMLCRHRQPTLRLAEAMASRKSIGICIETIENAINVKTI